MVVHAYNPAFRKLRQEKFEARLGYIIRPYLKKQKRSEMNTIIFIP
jgi:hypothetical protein